MTLEERLRPIQKAVDEAFTEDVSPEEGRDMLRRMLRDLTLMLMVLEIEMAAEDKHKTLQ